MDWRLSTSKMKLRYKKIVVLSLPRIFRFFDERVDHQLSFGARYEATV